ncbi:hypothetical protein [Shewanella colwelliana]|uniref:hypothetical protein n=1 Tax=Shewanella colwelliana TaxID=23 RepID=UPI00299D175A|nr:hypothetical protein [Shewanella colwelliana]MDX1282965.1 hypothetical protein [Shewanella colwelliana]
MKVIKYLVFTGLILSCSPQAKESPFRADDAELLQQSCREVIEIFDRKDQAGKYAALHTSMAEAMRAGYCIGVLQQYRKQSHSCYSSRYRRSNWFEMAKAIASLSIGLDELEGMQVSTLLEKVYCNG